MHLQDIQPLKMIKYSKSLFNVDQPSKLATFVNPIINVKLNTPLKHILEMMKKKKVHIAAVYDDADFKGIITVPYTHLTLPTIYSV